MRGAHLRVLVIRTAHRRWRRRWRVPAERRALPDGSESTLLRASMYLPGSAKRTLHLLKDSFPYAQKGVIQR